ncbi:MAG TPA: hypothetical protein PLV04_15825 [Phenylobacterium sp.]|nr:hypothetical protein [Phenylobacterium sp.]HQN52363.1 hypothetical protein [Phenylobacterium sp.]
MISLSMALWALAVGAASPDERVAPPQAMKQGVAGNGLYCLLAILEVVDEVGRRCSKEGDPEFVADVRSGISRLEAYARANGAATDSDLQRFRYDQAFGSAPDEAVCRNADAVALHDSFQASHQSRPQSLTNAIDQMTAAPGKPTWGTCL